MKPRPEKTQVADVFPIEDCHTLDLGIEGFSECPRIGPSPCRYALPFGYSFLCSHPRLQISSRTVERGAQGPLRQT